MLRECRKRNIGQQKTSNFFLCVSVLRYYSFIFKWNRKIFRQEEFYLSLGVECALVWEQKHLAL